MAKKGGVFQALGNLWRWTIWGLAAVLIAALWIGYSNQDGGPEGDVVAGVEAPEESAPAEQPATTEEAEAAEPVEEAPAETLAEAAENAAEGAAAAVEATADQAEAAASEAVENTVEEVQSALEGALGAAGEAASEAEGALSNLADQAGAAVERVEGALEGASDTEAPATALEEVPTQEAAIDGEQADLNILPPELSNITVPGDSATYSLISVFQRDDGTIEVVSDRTENGETVQTIRLVTCAPLAVGVISEGDGPRNEAPEMERITLGSAAATIAALACGAMN